MPTSELSCLACGHIEPARANTRGPFTCPAYAVTTLRPRPGRFQRMPLAAPAAALVSGARDVPGAR